MKWLNFKLLEFWYFARKILWKKPLPLLAYYVAELPDILKNRYIYVVGENGYLWFVALNCPCGCGDIIHLNLLPDANPRWKIEEHQNSTISISPSIWSRKGCNSHYFFKRGYVKWCNEDLIE